jgi:dTDP-4-amino-4,6-dideoxygalactose transaminase
MDAKAPRVSMLDLPAQLAPLREELMASIRRVVESGRFIMGPEIDRLEKEMASRAGAAAAVAVSSGTDALLVSLMALDIGPGSEVITTPFTFFATAGTVWRSGAKPVFVDIEPDTFNIDASRIEAAVTPKTRAVMPVHLYGQCADMDAICALAKGKGLRVIEDSCQAVCTEYAPGRQAGTIGDLGCLSFYPTKNLPGIGDAGMVLVGRDSALADRVKRLRIHGGERRYFHREVGGNFRMDEMQAAALNVFLPRLEGWIKARRDNAERYRKLFVEAGLAREKGLVLPVERRPHTYHQFVIRVPRRDALKDFLESKGIQTDVYYPLPLHMQECFRGLGYREGDFPEAERAAREVLALPINPLLTPAQQEIVVGTIGEFYRTS